MRGGEWDLNKAAVRGRGMKWYCCMRWRVYGTHTYIHTYPSHSIETRWQRRAKDRPYALG